MVRWYFTYAVICQITFIKHVLLVVYKLYASGLFKNNENFTNRRDFRRQENQHGEMDSDIPRPHSLCYKRHRPLLISNQSIYCLSRASRLRNTQEELPGMHSHYNCSILLSIHLPVCSMYLETLSHTKEMNKWALYDEQIPER